jgi:hypothetical protein
MISSDLHGAEEPIRWLLGWQRQDRVMTSPCMEKKKDTLIRTFWQRFDLWGPAPADGMMALMDRTPPRTGWTFSGADGSMLGLFGTHGRLQELLIFHSVFSPCYLSQSRFQSLLITPKCLMPFPNINEICKH